MRLKLYEDAVKAKTRKGSANGSGTKSESGDDPASAHEQEAPASAAAAEPADEPPTPSGRASDVAKGAGSTTRSQRGLALAQTMAMAEDAPCA